MSQNPPIDHDRLFKELIQTFFEEFMLLFFPDAHENIDFHHVHFLSEELFTDVTSGEKRRVDLLVQTKLKGTDIIIIVHIENQSYIQKTFHERMFLYFSRLYEKYRKPILPIAVFSYDKNREEPNYFLLDLPFFRILEFHFYTLEIRKLSWREYIQHSNPVSAALLSKMGYSDRERVQVKKEFLRILVNLELNPAQLQLIFGFFDTYLVLTDSEERILKEELSKLPPDEEAKIMEWKITYEEKGRLKGVEEGLIKGKIDTINMYLQTKFGEPSNDLQRLVTQLKEISIVNHTLIRLFSTDDLYNAESIIIEALKKQEC